MSMPAAISATCASVWRASASARCATRSLSTSATPSAGRSLGRSGPLTTSTRSTKRSPPFSSVDDSYALPQRQRHLTALILRKLLASSSHAIAGTLERFATALIEVLRDEQTHSDPELAEQLIEAEEIEDELLDEMARRGDWRARGDRHSAVRSSRQKLREEIDICSGSRPGRAASASTPRRRRCSPRSTSASRTCPRSGAARKALIFTESRRTQDYLKTFLEAHGYEGQLVLFNGTNGGPEATAIYERWVEKNQDTGRATGSRAVDRAHGADRALPRQARRS